MLNLGKGTGGQFKAMEGVTGDVGQWQLPVQMEKLVMTKQTVTGKRSILNLQCCMHKT